MGRASARASRSCSFSTPARAAPEGRRRRPGSAAAAGPAAAPAPRRPGQAPGIQPVEQGGGGADLLLHDVLLLTGDGPAVVPAAEPAQQVPGRVAAQDLPLIRVGAAVEGIRGEALQAGHQLVAGRQCPGGDQHAPQVREDRGLLQAVQLAVAKIAPAGRDAGQDGRDARPGEPAQRGPGRVGRCQRFPQRPKCRRPGRPAVPAAAVPAGSWCTGRPRAVRAGRAVGERGDGAVTADRFRHRARADRAGLAAAGAPACSPWQAGHHGSAVSREVPQDRIWSQTEHSSTGSGGQPGQNGPSGLRVFTTRRDRSSRRPRG